MFTHLVQVAGKLLHALSVRRRHRVWQLLQAGEQRAAARCHGCQASCRPLRGVTWAGQAAELKVASTQLVKQQGRQVQAVPTAASSAAAAGALTAASALH